MVSKGRLIFERLGIKVQIIRWAHKKSAPIGCFVKKDKKFDINLFGIDNYRWKQNPKHNDYYTGIFAIDISYFIKFVEDMDLEIMCLKKKALEKELMCFTYNNIENFRMVNKTYVWRGGDKNDYYSISQN